MEILTAITDNAAQHITWTLMLLGGTLLMVVGTSHVSPLTAWGRSFYVILIPAWGLLAASMFYGDRVHRRAISALMVNSDKVTETHKAMNADFICQLHLLMFGAACLAAWLICYIVWWIGFRKA